MADDFTEIDQEEERVEVKLTWGPNNHLQTIYANQLFISHAGREFYLIFGELVPPTPGEDIPEELMIEPVLRVAVSPHAMLNFAEAIQRNVVNFIKKVEESEAEPEGGEQ